MDDMLRRSLVEKRDRTVVFQYAAMNGFPVWFTQESVLAPIRRLIANVARFQVILHCKVSLNLFGPGFVKPFGYLISCQSYYSWFRIRFGVTLNSLCGVLVE